MEDSSLSKLLTTAYRETLPHGVFINFHEMDKEQILSEIDLLEAGDFVALVQSKSFRLSDFRIRIELFKMGIKVAEHPHLARMSQGDEPTHYVNALAYDKAYYHHNGHTLKSLLEKASTAVIYCGEEQLIYPSAFESAKLNIGDYREMKNIGGQFPIGEVFTELKTLTDLSGRAKVMAFGDINYKVNIPKEPITIIIDEGKVVGTQNSTEDFEVMLNLIRDEETLWVRELGLGLNRALSPKNFVSDMGTFERMSGIHLSLGAKHGIYAKEGMKRNSGKFHIDVMLETTEFRIDDELVFDGKRWLV